ncbi:MAG: hypothetical protein M1483_06600 [Actinobacteria bacterium]|nr:hypothetical protein [Actinomycetota bacterium]MCL6105276.1 hypothetical protein [Actinomycetota bacterium]
MSGLSAGQVKRLRRNRFLLAMSLVMAIVVVSASFPFGQLISQYNDTSNVTAQLATAQSISKQFKGEIKQLNSPEVVTYLAHKFYGFIPAGSQAYTILQGNSTGTANTGVGNTGVGNTGVGNTGVGGSSLSKPLPDQFSGMRFPDLSGIMGSQTSRSSYLAGGSNAKGFAHSDVFSAIKRFFDRVLSNLEFWKQ